VERNLPFSLSISFPNDIKKFSRNFLFSFPSFTPFSYILVRQKMAHWPVHKSKSAVPIFPLEVKRAGRWHNGQRTRPCKADLYTGGQVRRKMAHRPAQSTPDKTTLSDPHVFYAQPPPGGQPLLSCWQHHAFFATDQPCCQFQKPALQS